MVLYGRCNDAMLAEAIMNINRDFDTRFLSWILKNAKTSTASEVTRAIIRFNARVLARLVYSVKKEKLKALKE